MSSQHTLWRFEQMRIGACLLLGATFTLLSAFAPAQEHFQITQEPTGVVAADPTNLVDALLPKGVGFAQQFGVKDVRCQLREYGKVGIETAGSDTKDLMKTKVDKGLAFATEADMRPKFTALGGLAADVNFLGALREVAAIEVKYEVALGSAPMSSGRPRSNAIGSPEESEARARDSSGRPRSDAIASADDPRAPRAPGELTKAVRLCGFTVELNQKEDDKAGPKELLPGGIMTQVMVGPVPLLIRANAGVGIEHGAGPFVETATVDGQRSCRFGVQATAGAYLNGWVVAGVGGGCRFASACAGVKGDIRLMETTAGLRLGFGTRDGLLAQLRTRLSPAVLKLSAIAYVELKAGWVKIGKTFELLLYQWSAPAFEAIFGA